MLTLLGIALTIAGVQSGSLGAFLIWLGCDFLLLGIAHFRKAHGLFGKRPDGTLPLWSWIIFLPLFSFSIAVWHIARLLSAEPPFSNVSNQLVVGRRLLSSEVPGEFANYIDLTAELQEPRSLREAPGYLAFPVLDASAPTPECLRAAVSRLHPGTTFIHCAQGHGRTGLFALAVLLTSGAVRTVDEGLSMLANARPAIRLSPEQTECIRAYATTVA
jgi:protein-tyrosine phosphatase